jgi:FAD/FMN-containing dehydrogenase/Fe-S oxidoreductase
MGLGFSDVTTSSTAPPTVPTAGLAAALRKAGLAEVDTSVRRRAEYSADASNYRVVPSAVAYPRHPDEIIAALATCTELGVPLVARGGGTSIAGNSIGDGLVLDTSRHLNRVVAVDPETRTAVVEPGTVLDDITRAAARYGLRFGPDPSTHSRCTIGGAIGNNACGNRALRYGRTSDNVIELDVITGTGVRLTAGLGGDAAPLARLRELVGGNLATIRTEFGRFTRQVSGYGLEHLLPENGFDVAKFLVGSEGTLALTLGATVNLVQAPRATALAVLGYPDIASAAEDAPALLPHAPVALEGFDSRIVDVLRTRRGPAAVPGLPEGGAWLFIETAGETEDDARSAASRLAADASCQGSLILTGPDARALWRIREDGAGLSGRTTAGRPAWPGWEDSAVPPAKLGPYLRELDALMKSYRVDGAMYGHLGDGCIHIRIDFPLADRPGVLRSFAEDATRLAASYGGTASGEHGDGRARSELLPLQYSPSAMSLFGAVKEVFDPAGVLNPGVLVNPAPLDAGLRVPAARPLSTGLGFIYPNDDGDFSTAVHRCTGVGRCRADSTASGGVMCPSYLATRDEKDSTRGRARVLQEMANGTLVGGWDSPALAESLDLCLSCKGCASDCPTGIDMATYKAEATYQRYRGRLRPASHYALGWLPRWAGLATALPGLARLANVGMRLGPLAALGKRLAGIDQRRDLPAFASRTFRQWFAGRPVITGKPVLLWVDTFTNAFSPEVGQAAVKVLEAAGYSVRVTSSQACCGLTWISTGQLDGARRQLRRTLAALAPALDAGIPIVGLEPSCTAALREDAGRLLASDPRVAALESSVKTLAELLRSTPGWTPPDLSDVTGVAQPHCHQHAVLGWDADAFLLKEAGADVKAVGGCCGLAGNFGVEEGHYDVSVAVAETALLPAVRSAGPDATVLADGFSCRTQLDQLARVRGQHLAEVLASRLDLRRGCSVPRRISQATASTVAKTGSQASRCTIQAGLEGSVSRPGARPASMLSAQTTMNAVWCHRNRVIADTLARATTAQAAGRRIHRVSGPRSSSASPHCAIPKVTAARVGGFRFEIAAPFTPTMLAG